MHCVWIFSLTVALVAQDGGAAKPTREEIARAIEELGAGRFEARQAATDWLWRAGETAEEALKEAAKSTDPEIRARARAVLNKLRLGIRPETPPEVLALIDQFRYASAADQRRQALVDLQAKGHWQTVLTLIRGIENVQERRNLATAMSTEAGKIASSLVAKGETAQAEEVLEVVATSDTGMPQLTAFLALTNRLDAKIAAAREQTNDQPKDEHWSRLAYLLRAKGDQAKAIEAAAQTSDLVLRTNLLAEGKRWAEAADFAENLYQRNTGRLASAAFAATYFRLAGNAAGQQRVLDVLLKAASVEKLDQLKPGEAPMNPFAPLGSPIAQDYLWIAAETLLVNERIDEALPILRKINPRFAYSLYQRQQRHGDALALVGVTAEKSLDRAWLDSLPLPMAGGQWSAVSDQSVQQEWRVELGAQVARHLRELGRKEQVEQICKTLRALEPPASEQGRRKMQLAVLAWQLGRYDEAATDAAASIAAGINAPVLFSALLRSQGPLAAFWYERMIAANPQMERSKAVEKALWLVVPEPRRGKPPEDWRALVSAARESADKAPLLQTAQTLASIGETYVARGERELAQQCFAEASEADPGQALRAGDLLLADGNAASALKFYAAAAKARPNDAIAGYLYGYTLAKTGAKEMGEKQVRAARLLALAPEARLLLAGGLAQRGLKTEALEELELVQRTALPDSPQTTSGAQLMGSLAYEAEPLRAADAWDQLRLHVLNVSNFNETDAYLTVPQRTHQWRAKAALAAGDATKAAAELEQCDKLMPGDVRLIVELVPKLNGAETRAVGDALFERGLAVHRRVLEEFPTSAMHLNNTAWICARAQRNLDEALALVQKAVELAPDEAAYQDTLAEVHFQLGNREQAVAAARRCLEIAPDNKMFATRLKHFEKDELKTLDGTEGD